MISSYLKAPDSFGWAGRSGWADGARISRRKKKENSEIIKLVLKDKAKMVSSYIIYFQGLPHGTVIFRIVFLRGSYWRPCV